MKDNFDDILKSKWEQFHFPVDDKHRQDMIALLDNQKRRRKGLLWWWTGLAGVVVAVAFILYWQQTNGSDKAMVPMQSSSVSEKQVAETTSDNNKLHGSIGASIEEKNVDVKHASKSTDAEQSRESSSPNRPTTTSSTPKEKLSSSSSSSVSDIPAARTNSNGSNNNNPLKSNDAGKKEQKTDKAFAYNEKTSIPDNAIKDEEKEISHTASEAISNIVNPSPNTINNNEEPTVIAQRDNHITDYLPGLTMQSLQYTLDDEIKADAIVINRRPINLFAEAGAGMVFGSKPDYTSGWTLNAGAGLDYSLNQKTHLVLSGGYLLQNGGFDFERSSTVNQLSFGSRSSFHTLSPEKLHFIYLKTGVHHHIHRHMISVLGGVQYLYGAQGDITIQVNDQLLGESTENPKQNVWLKLDGMQRYLISAEIKYGYQITPKLSIHSGIRYYFTGIEAKDPELESKGFYWNGKYSRISPFFTLNYQLYGTR